MTDADEDDAAQPHPRPAGSVDGAGLSRLFRPSGREEDRQSWDDEAIAVVGAYVFALDPGVARRAAEKLRGGD